MIQDGLYDAGMSCSFLEARDDAVTSLIDQFGAVRYDAAPSFLLVRMRLLVLCN